MEARRNIILVADRFPFRYFTYEYGLEYYAAFSGCSTDTEPSAATVAFLINKVREYQLPVVFHIELSTERIADTISEATGARKLLLHSAHNLSMRDFNDGITYLDIQRINVENLRQALW
jgi:zinc transport system substrate-binding protein